MLDILIAVGVVVLMFVCYKYISRSKVPPVVPVTPVTDPVASELFRQQMLAWNVSIYNPRSKTYNKAAAEQATLLWNNGAGDPAWDPENPANPNFDPLL